MTMMIFHGINVFDRGVVIVNDHVGKDDMDDMRMNVVFQSQLTFYSDRKTPSPLRALISSSPARWDPASSFSLLLSSRLPIIVS